MPKADTSIDAAFNAGIAAADAATERARAEYLEDERARQLRRSEAVAQFEALRAGLPGAEPLPLSDVEREGLSIFRRASADMISNAGGASEVEAMRAYLALMDRLFGVEE